MNSQVSGPDHDRPRRSPGHRGLRCPACINDVRQIRKHKGSWTGADSTPRRLPGAPLSRKTPQIHPSARQNPRPQPHGNRHCLSPWCWCHTPIVKSRTVPRLSRGSRPVIRPHELSGQVTALASADLWREVVSDLLRLPVSVCPGAFRAQIRAQIRFLPCEFLPFNRRDRAHSGRSLCLFGQLGEQLLRAVVVAARQGHGVSLEAELGTEPGRRLGE